MFSTLHWLWRLSIPLLLFSILFNALSQPISINAELFLSTSEAENPPARILLLTAHPDDECLFFGPTILSLLSQPSEPFAASPPQLYSLCLSVGDADGLGGTRREELERSLDTLGVDADNRWVLDRPDLKDNITVHWNAETIANVIEPYVLKHAITAILTFDDQGVSSHPNHISLPLGAAHLVKHLDIPAPPRLFTLISVPLLHKYTGPLAPLLANIDLIFAGLGTSVKIDDTNARKPNDGGSSARGGRLGDEDTRVVFVSAWSNYWKALQAMQQHQSQFVWFRWLYVSFSRYMWVNEWVEIRASA